MNEPIREKSCGAVVYWQGEGERLYLIEQMRGGHFAMPKGHVEAGESEAQTAAREIREETGLLVTVDTGFRQTDAYSPYPGCVKEVVYFTARASSRETTVQPEEVRAIVWLPLHEALKRLTYKSDREILHAADAWLDRA